MLSLNIEWSCPLSREEWDLISGIAFQSNSLGIDEGELAPPEGISALHAADEFKHALNPGFLDPPQKFSIYFTNAEELELFIEKLTSHFDRNLYTFTQSEVDTSVDYSEAWKENFKPLDVPPHWYIRAPWHEPRHENTKKEIIIEPGMAFGTGTHETTRACLELLSTCINENTKHVLDFGCGSGILAIACKKLGVAEVDAIDIDPLSVTATVENAKRNSVSLNVTDSMHTIEKQTYDGIIANILRDTLLSFKDFFSNNIRSGGFLILSGILKEQKDEIISEFNKYGFKLSQEIIRQDSSPQDLLASNEFYWTALKLTK